MVSDDDSLSVLSMRTIERATKFAQANHTQFGRLDALTVIADWLLSNANSVTAALGWLCRGASARKEFQFRATNSVIMKTILIASIAAIAFTHAANARTWAYFHGDIGIASPFVASGPHGTTVTQQRTTKSKPVQKRPLAKAKTSSGKRLASR